ncbi:MAG: hypothetical protein KJZ85_13750 [Rhodobacteraceae bacterium]|jgi:hypothetical protein|nr:hypothetical protein [Paracoccaceae bacterium]
MSGGGGAAREELKFQAETPFVRRFTVNGLQIDTFCFLRPRSGRIAFLGQSALTRENKDRGLPFFFRNSWVPDLDCSTVIFNDPTLYLYDDLLCGWSQGSPEHFAIPAMGKTCEAFLAALGPDTRPGFYGSSAGGFWALFMAALFDAPCVVETPQTDMFAYPLMEPREHLFRRCYRDHGLAPEAFRHRLSVVDWYEHLGAFPRRISYFQSRRDTGHAESQMRPFLERMKGRPCQVSEALYDRPAESNAHGPMQKGASLMAIRSLFD